MDFFKVTDRIEIIDNINNHEFNVGDIGCIIEPHKKQNNKWEHLVHCPDTKSRFKFWFIYYDDMQLTNEKTTNEYLREILEIVGEIRDKK